MKALVYLGPATKALKDGPKPQVTAPTDNRLEVPKRLGATAIVNGTDGKAPDAATNPTDRRGVDTALDAVGIPATLELCEKIVAPGGIIANIGVRGAKGDLHVENVRGLNITSTTHLVDTVGTPMPLNSLQSRKIDPKLLITHRFKLDHILDAYETFGHAANTRALNVIIEA